MRSIRIALHPVMRIGLAVGAVALSSGATAQSPTSASAGAAATILRSLTAQQEESLAFGRILPPASGASLTILPDGTMACEAPLRCLDPGQAGRFRLVGSDSLVRISVGGSVRLSAVSAEQEGGPILLTPIAASQMMAAGGGGTVTVGGRLDIPAGAIGGAYRGEYIISFEYQ